VERRERSVLQRAKLLGRRVQRVKRPRKLRRRLCAVAVLPFWEFFELRKAAGSRPPVNKFHDSINILT
jgi:hypothetical protein